MTAGISTLDLEEWNYLDVLGLNDTVSIIGSYAWGSAINS